MGFIKSQLKGDSYIWVIFFLLAITSMVCSFSSSSFLAFRSEVFYAPIMKHISHLFMGFLVMIIASNIPIQVFRNTSWLAFVAAVGSLIAVQLVDSSSGGANRQIAGFQPSEIGKYASITLCAIFLSQGQIRGVLGVAKEKLIPAIAIPALISVMILFDNLSTAALLGLTIAGMVYTSGISHRVFIRYLMLPTVGFVMVAYTCIMYLPDELVFAERIYTWRARIERAFSDDEPLVTQKIDDKNRQVIFGQMAVARGGVLGNPFNSQMRDFLPLAFSDFIYSMVIEEWGLVGGIFVLLLYLLLLIRVSIIFSRCNNLYAGLLMLGLTMSIVLQALVNMSVGVKLIPVTGQPLPLISFGGSSILMTCFYFGIIQSVSSRIGFGEEGLRSDKLYDMIFDPEDDSNPDYDDYDYDVENTEDNAESAESEDREVDEVKEKPAQKATSIADNSEVISKIDDKKLEEDKVPLYPF